MASGNPALIVRVAATIEELRANLKEGVSQIETTTAAMGKLASSFSGDKLLQAAQNVTAAVNQIGGASKLTDAEAARVNATLEKALEKYAQLGREAPPGMRQLADETKRVESVSSGLTDTLKQVALGFVAMFTARAAFNFVKDTIEEASALKDLSQQSHINVEELQLMAGAMSEFGVDADTLGKGLFKLSRGIAGGDESVTRGLHLMGLSLKDVEGLNGEALFLKIENGLATLQGGLRDTAAADLFGGKLGAAMAGASEGIEGALATWKRLNHVASTESVDAMDAFGESIVRANKNISSIAANLIGPLAQGFNVLNEASDKGASKWAIFGAVMHDAWDSGWGRGESATHLATLLDHLNQTTEQGTAVVRAQTVVLTEQQKVHAFMAALQRDAAVALEPEQLRNLAHLKEIGALTAANAAAIGVNANQFERYKEQMTEAAAAAKKHADALEELRSAGVGWQGTLATMNGLEVDAIRGYLEAGVSQNALAEAYHKTATQIASVAAFEKDQVAQQKINDAQVVISTKLWDDYDVVVGDGATNAYGRAQLAIDRWAKDLKAQLAAAKTGNAELYAQIDQLEAAKQNLLLKNTLEADVHTHEHFVKLADEARLAYEFATAHASSFSSAWIQYLRDTADAASITAQVWTDSLGGALEGLGAQADQTAQKIAGIPDQVKAASDAVTAMIAPTTFELGGQKWPIGMMPNTGILAIPHPSMGGFAGGVTNAPGGWAMVGERGPEPMYVPPGANIYPSGSRAGGGITIEAGAIVIHGSVLANQTQLATAIGDAILHKFTASGGRLPGA